MKQSIVKIENLTYEYGNNLVLNDINLEIKQGEFFGLLGPNGSGKSTLLKLILGLLPKQKGNIYLFNEPINKFGRWSKIGYVSQKANSFNTGFPATVNEVVAMGLYGKRGLFKRLTKNDQIKVKEAINIVGLGELEQRNIGKLSGGQQQRTFIARGIVNEPELLILDEPTVGIDADSTKSFYQLMEKLNKELGITIILVSHDIGVVTEQVTKLACLNKKLFFHGTPQKFEESKGVLQKTYGVDMGLVTHHHHLGE